MLTKNDFITRFPKISSFLGLQVQTEPEKEEFMENDTLIGALTVAEQVAQSNHLEIEALKTQLSEAQPSRPVEKLYKPADLVDGLTASQMLILKAFQSPAERESRAAHYREVNQIGSRSVTS